MLFQSFVSLSMQKTNSVVGVGIYSGFRPTLEYPGKWISIYNRPRYLPTRKYLCYTKGGTLDPDEIVYDIFQKICLEMEDREIISRVLKYFGSCTGEDLLNKVKVKGAGWFVKNKPSFLKSAYSIHTTKACLLAELHSAQLERTDQQESVLKVGFWYGAWKRFLFEVFSDRSSNGELIARQSLYDTLQINESKGEFVDSQDILVDKLLEILRKAIPNDDEGKCSDSENGLELHTEDEFELDRE
uniref:Uncharacterized protein n=1 Tax=Pratia nummularia TaxID=368691 RepID=A0A1Z2R154_9ASTR|nr:hypothetical protein Lo_num1Pt0329 [Pratia nummularia]ASA37387.1 hypothetical protein Lo_num1Pt0329 [Pratia nummularia]